MDLESEDIDDPMEIDTSVHNSAIIENSASLTEEAAPSTSRNENETSLEKQVLKEVSAPEDKPKKDESDSPVVILDDDDDDSSAVPPARNSPEKPATVDPPPPKTDSLAKQEEQSSVQEIINLVDKSKSSRCLNPNCAAESSIFISAADFCLSYFRVKRSKSRKEEICINCYDVAVAGYDKLVTGLKSGGLVFETEVPIINETLQIDDSDEEEMDSSVNDEDYIDEENFKFISENIDAVMENIIEKLDLRGHMNAEEKYIDNEINKEGEQLEDLSKTVKDIRTSLDKIQLDLYQQFRPQIKPLRGIQIVDDLNISNTTLIKADAIVGETVRKNTRAGRPPLPNVDLNNVNSNVTQTNSPTKATIQQPKSSLTNTSAPPPVDLPPIGSVETAPLKIGQIYYITRENNSAANWIKARLLSINGDKYSLVELKQQRQRVVTGKEIAYFNSATRRLRVGTRVIASFKNLNPGNNAPRHDPMYAGIVAEPPCDGNRFRYLIFFDIGYSQYVSYGNVHLIYAASKKVWEDMPKDSQPFIQRYLEGSDRPMVKLAKGESVKVEYNGKWWNSTVKEVDCALVQINFDILNRMEWIYRGSSRLSPLYMEEQAIANRQTSMRSSRKAGQIQYTRNDLVQQNNADPPPTTARAVARKSTTRPQSNVQSNVQPNIVPYLPTSNNNPGAITPTNKIMYFTPRDQEIVKRVYRPHTCSPKCKMYVTHNFSKLKGHNPLSKPLLCGWARLTSKSKGKKDIIYKAPCGRLLRNIAEVHYYLRVTQSEMTVDLYDFNHMVRCLAEFCVECTPDPKDLSRGVEQVPIPVVNGIDNAMLDFCNYTIKRVPMDKVNLNLDPEFLCGCDCDDDCIDKTKCACWKLTLEGAKFIGKDLDPNSIGYIYRRLPEQVITGIYECNSRCKCKSTCLNRVVQNPMGLKLQVFKTLNRGWGIRCLNDVPQGSFICIYAGTIHTEQMANENGLANGDEYFAELDYIESVESFKEGYEKEAYEDEDYKNKSENESNGEDDDDDHDVGEKSRNRYHMPADKDFRPSMNYSDMTESGIRTRLRKRNETEEKKEVKVLKKEEDSKANVKTLIDSVTGDIDTVTISDDEDEGREVLSFNPKNVVDEKPQSLSVRDRFGDGEDSIYIMDAKNAGNIGRFLNHSCSPNVFVQNVFVDTHDPRFPWVAFFSSQFIRAGTELTWNYNYDIGSVPGRVLYCECASTQCKGRLL